LLLFLVISAAFKQNLADFKLLTVA